MNNLVTLQYLNDYNFQDLKNAVEKSFDALNLNLKNLQNKTVLIKACLNKDVSKDMAETTHPAVIRAVVEVLSSNGIKCVVADSPNGKHNDGNLKSVYLNTGMLDMANTTNCELNSNLKTSDLQLKNGLKAKNVKILDVINEVDAIINLGKLKFDANLGYLGAMSNLFGIIPGEVKNLMLNRLNTLADFNDLLIDMHEELKNKILVNILDAVVCLEAGGTQRMLNCLAMSEHAFSLDATMFDILNIKFANTVLKQAKNRNLFDYKKPYKIILEKLDRFKLEDFLIVDYDTNKIITQPKGYFKAHQARPVIDKKLCKGCKICSKICPTDAILMKYDNNGELYAEIDYSQCIFCNKCITACPYGVVKQKTPLGYKAIMKDAEKYNKDNT